MPKQRFVKVVVWVVVIAMVLSLAIATISLFA
ncbi:MAG TPA: stressosome-associated protein Prli42 [Acidimicrobiia bacterium]|nr:stressosome-associated protein Prli42 [Acidimicrobiia bacterium]